MDQPDRIEFLEDPDWEPPLSEVGTEDNHSDQLAHLVEQVTLLQQHVLVLGQSLQSNRELQAERFDTLRLRLNAILHYTLLGIRILEFSAVLCIAISLGCTSLVFAHHRLDL